MARDHLIGDGEPLMSVGLISFPTRAAAAVGRLKRRHGEAVAEGDRCGAQLLPAAVGSSMVSRSNIPIRFRNAFCPSTLTLIAILAIAMLDEWMNDSGTVRGRF